MPENPAPGWRSVNRRPAHNLFFAVMLPGSLEEDISNLFEKLTRDYRLSKMHIPIEKPFALAADARSTCAVNRLFDRIRGVMATLPVRESVLIHSHAGKSRYDVSGRSQLAPFQ